MGIICGMNLTRYVDKYANTTDQFNQFAADVGISPQYLRHLISGFRPKPELKIVLGLVTASGGMISLHTIRPDLFDGPEVFPALKKSINQSCSALKKAAA